MNPDNHPLKGKSVVRSERIKHANRKKDPFEEIVDMMEDYDKGCEKKPLKYNADE